MSSLANDPAVKKRLPEIIELGQLAEKAQKFGRVKKQRTALMFNLAKSFIINGEVMSTEPKIKALRPLVEKMITRSKTDNLANRKYLISKTGGVVTRKLIEDVAPKYTNRLGGYTRIIKMPRRITDGSKMAQLNFVE